MSHHRVLKYLNLLIALTVVVLAASVAWFFWRPLPKTSGRVKAPVSARATVTRDSLGVPHIQAANIEDALFLQGYVTAQDRLWQMDAIRRAASGTLAEIIGAPLVEIDREARRMRLRRVAEEHVSRMKPEDIRWLAAYTRGVNHFLETSSALPVEFTVLGYQPRPWAMADTIAVGMQMYRDLTATWKLEVGKAAMLAGGERPLVEQLYPTRTGPEVQVGSNAWAVAGARTATGKPILANDPHLEWGVPSTWYFVHLTAPGLNVAGATLPGVPAVIVGHNDRIAWGVTNLGFDVLDLYFERIDVRTGQYVHKGQVEQARREHEVILVKGGMPVDFNNLVTRHGPLWTMAPGQALTLRWTAAEPGLFNFPFVQLNTARNWTEFREALRRFPGPGQNFVYADVDGNIGYQATGMLPVRRNYEGDVPVDGSSGEFEWDGYIPFDELPSIYNPPSGMIVTANQNPFPRDWKYRVNGNFEPGYRAAQIHAMLSARKGWKPEDMLAVQKDVYSAYLHDLAREFVKAADKHGVKDPSLSDAVRLLREWNGQVEKDLAAPMIAQLAYRQIFKALAERAGGPQGPNNYLGSVSNEGVISVVKRRPPEWTSDWDQLLVRCLVQGLEEGRNTQGSNINKWQYGRFLTLELKHPILSRIPYVDYVPYLSRIFSIEPSPMSGSSTSVKQTSARVGPSMRFIANTADWNGSLANVTLGQSGQPLSSHFKDQWDEYWSGKSFPFRWTGVSGDELLVEPGR